MTEHLGELIRANMARYVEGSTSLDAFEDWFVPATWDIEKSEDPSITDLVSEIMLRLAEYSNGHWTEAEMREHMARLLEASPALRR